MKKTDDLKVFITSRESTCDECGENLGRKAWITLTENRGALCLSCADMDHLVFLPSGDAALTRRARKHSTLSAVVLKWSRARKRYERRGILVEESGLEKAEAECLADADARARRRERQAQRRSELDRQYIDAFAARIRELYPRCPARTALRLAVAAHIRHVETSYDRLLANGWDRMEARGYVEKQVHAVLAKWEGESHGDFPGHCFQNQSVQ